MSGGEGLNLDQSLNKTNTKANKGNNNEQQQKRLLGDGGTERGNPRYSGVNKGSDGGEDISHESTPLKL